jgi:3-oxo-5-alpha-steroid 4-dehydrogenase 1
MDMYLPTYNTVLWAMAVMGLFVFVALYFVDAGYGKFRSKKWGLSINNKIGWLLMECPALIPIVYVLLTMKPSNLALLFMGLYAMHYIYRSFVFPTLLKGKSKMPFAIIDMGALFNFVNSSLLCASVVAFPKESYTDIASYAGNWNFWVGIVLFFAGMYTHMKADHTIRNLRKPGDTNHYLPQGGLFDYVTSANYFGELLEWTGFAILLNNPAAWMFVWWTAANLVPRAHSINKKYRQEFGNDAVGERKRIIPYIY